MTTGSVAQVGAEVLYRVTPEVRVSQTGVEYAHRVIPGLRVGQAGLEYVHRVQPGFAVTQAGLELLYKSVPCGTRWAQIWTITRTDGTVYRFTSLDRNLEYPTGSGVTYQSCGSLDPSASENVSQLDDAGSMDLSGAIGSGDGQITEIDLYAGLFDGAEVEAWLVAWDGGERIKRLLKGTFGAVEQSATGFKIEVLGDGAKLMQTPLIELLQPGCRWLSAKYGGFGGPFCGKDLGPLTVTGTVDSGSGVRSFVDAARSETAGYFSRGRVTFTGGDNAGITAEIKEHTAGGHFELWPRLPFAISAGDTYSMKPGCTGLKDATGGTNGCTAWANLLRYGGFDKVPGGDQRSKTPDVK